MLCYVMLLAVSVESVTGHGLLLQDVSVNFSQIRMKENKRKKKKLVNI